MWPLACCYAARMVTFWFSLLLLAPGSHGHGAVTRPSPRLNAAQPWCPWCVGAHVAENPSGQVHRQARLPSPCHGTSRGATPYPFNTWGPYKDIAGNFTRQTYAAGSAIEATIVLDADHNGDALWQYCPHSEEETEACFWRRPSLDGWTDVHSYWDSNNQNDHWKSHEHFPQMVPLPANMPLGGVTLRWMWVCKYTDEIFVSCIDANIMASGSTAPPTPPPPTPPPSPSPSTPAPSDFSSRCAMPAGIPAQTSAKNNVGFVACHGKLRVEGVQLVDEGGVAVQLMGMSSHGLHWFPNCYTKASIQHLTESWGTNVFRAAMYVGEGGYSQQPGLKETVKNIIQWCKELGVYVIIDWHVLTPGDPNAATYHGAVSFFEDMARFVRGENHVLFEICNEPNGVSWSTVKSYADNLIAAIRAIDQDIIIIVGTPTWSQDIQEARRDPVSNPHNVMYAFHFYAGSHMGLLERVRSEAALIPIFATEWGTSTYSGDGGVFLEDAQTFLDLFRDASGQKISWAQWSFADKDESSAALMPSSCSSQKFDATSCSGTYLKNYIRAYVETCPTGPTLPPTPRPPTPPPTYTPTVPAPPPTPAPPAGGQCYVVECGCPPFVNGQSWCQEGAAGVINSPWCLASASNCAQCNGKLCYPTPYPSPNPTPRPPSVLPTPRPPTPPPTESPTVPTPPPTPMSHAPSPVPHPPSELPTPKPPTPSPTESPTVPTPLPTPMPPSAPYPPSALPTPQPPTTPPTESTSLPTFSPTPHLPTPYPTSPVGYDVYALEKECAGEAIFDGDDALCLDSCRKCPFCKFATTYGSHSLRCRLRTHCDELVEAAISSVTYRKAGAGGTRRLLIV